MFSRLLRSGLGTAVHWFSGTARRAAAFVSGQLDLESPEKLKVQSQNQKKTIENQKKKIAAQAEIIEKQKEALEQRKNRIETYKNKNAYYKNRIDVFKHKVASQKREIEGLARYTPCRRPPGSAALLRDQQGRRQSRTAPRRGRPPTSRAMAISDPSGYSQRLSAARLRRTSRNEKARHLLNGPKAARARIASGTS